MTGDTVSPDARAFIESAGREVLHKPFSLDELRQRMEQFAAAKDERMAAAERARRPDLAAGLGRLAKVGHR
jgi:DNA-binding response OmpR family regulator